MQNFIPWIYLTNLYRFYLLYTYLITISFFIRTLHLHQRETTEEIQSPTRHNEISKFNQARIRES